jgi:glycine cleavage system H protein
MNIPEDLRYTAEHEWIRIGGDGRFVVGITDFAQSAMGDVVHVDHPALGATPHAGDPVAEIESTKSVSEIYAPVSGRVVAINEAIDERPEVVNVDPYGEGWLFVLESGESEPSGALLSPEEYAALVAEADG